MTPIVACVNVPVGASDPSRTMDDAIAEQHRSVLDRVEWQIAGRGGAAEVLEINPSTLRFRMKKLGIRHPAAR